MNTSESSIFWYTNFLTFSSQIKNWWWFSLQHSSLLEKLVSLDNKSVVRETLYFLVYPLENYLSQANKFLFWSIWYLLQTMGLYFLRRMQISTHFTVLENNPFLFHFTKFLVRVYCTVASGYCNKGVITVIDDNNMKLIILRNIRGASW